MVFVGYLLSSYTTSHAEVGQKNLKSGKSALISRSVWGEWLCLPTANQYLLSRTKQTPSAWEDLSVTNMPLFCLRIQPPALHPKANSVDRSPPGPKILDWLPTLFWGPHLVSNFGLAQKIRAYLSVWLTRKSVRIPGPCRALKNSFSSVRFRRRQET